MVSKMAKVIECDGWTFKVLKTQVPLKVECSIAGGQRKKYLKKLSFGMDVNASDRPGAVNICC